MQTTQSNENDDVTGVLRAPNGLRIVASKDWIPGNAGIEKVSCRPDGTLDIVWSGETQIGWDGQHTEEIGGQRIFLDENGGEWRENCLTLVHAVTGEMMRKDLAGADSGDEYAGMDDADLNTALTDLVDAIRGITLGSIEDVVIAAAGAELIRNWNDHDPITKIDEGRELANWERQTGIPL